MYKIYSRPRIIIPKLRIRKTTIKEINNIKNSNNNEGQIKKIDKSKIIVIIIIMVIAFATAKTIIDAVYPIFDSLCETKAKSVATIISNKQATKVMKEHTYDEMFLVEKDSNENITMIKSNMVAINEIISDVAVRIQEDMNKEGRESIEIAARKFYRIKIISWKRSRNKNTNITDRNS